MWILNFWNQEVPPGGVTLLPNSLHGKTYFLISWYLDAEIKEIISFTNQLCILYNKSNNSHVISVAIDFFSENRILAEMFCFSLNSCVFFVLLLCAGLELRTRVCIHFITVLSILIISINKDTIVLLIECKLNSWILNIHLYCSSPTRATYFLILSVIKIFWPAELLWDLSLSYVD